MSVDDRGIIPSRSARTYVHGLRCFIEFCGAFA